mgnify:FL=1
MITERLWRLIKSYVNDAIDAALDARGYHQKEAEPSYDWEKRYQQYQQQQKNQDDFYQKYERYKQYQQKSQGGSYQQQSSQNSDDVKYYGYLELPYGASFEDVKKAYKELMKKYHPDKFYDNDTKRKAAEKVCQKLNEAYQYFGKKFGK